MGYIFGGKLCVVVDNARRFSSVSRLVRRINYICFKLNYSPSFLEFNREDIIDEVYSDAILKLKDMSQQMFLDLWLKESNIYYSDAMLPEQVALWRDENMKTSIFLDINRRLDYEIIQEFRDLLKDYFGIKITLDRHMHFYSRQGMKFITNKPYTYDDILEVSRRALGYIGESVSVEDKKNYLSQPTRSNDKIFGGYAKHCPLCGSRVHTELTDFRIVKISQAGTVNNKEIRDEIHLMCCQNCHDAFRYSEGYYVDLNKWHKTGVLSMTVLISGVRWNPNEFTPKLAHQAYLYAMNKDNFVNAGCNWENAFKKTST